MYQRNNRKSYKHNFKQMEEAEMFLRNLYSRYEDVTRRVFDLIFSADNSKMVDLDMYKRYLNEEAEAMINVACGLAEPRCTEWTLTIDRLRKAMEECISEYIHQTVKHNPDAI